MARRERRLEMKWMMQDESLTQRSSDLCVASVRDRISELMPRLLEGISWTFIDGIGRRCNVFIASTQPYRARLK